MSALTGDVFLAEVVLDDGAVVDARPSDALTLALVARARILADPALLEARVRPGSRAAGGPRP